VKTSEVKTLRQRRCSLTVQRHRFKRQELIFRCWGLSSIIWLERRSAGLGSLLLHFLVVEEINSVLIRILPTMVVPHHGLRVSVLRHPLHLPVHQTGLSRPCDGRPTQVVRREAPEDSYFSLPIRARSVSFLLPRIVS
jgi:hypothetical protein